MRRGIAALRTRCAGAGREDGNAMVEFIGAAVLLLLPVMYIGIALARLQAGTFATEAAAREIGRVVVTSADASERAALSDAALRLALDDQGFDPDGAEVAVTCATATCPAAGGEVTVRVLYPVELPFVPRFVGEAVPLSVPVEAVHVAPVGDHVVP